MRSRNDYIHYVLAYYDYRHRLCNIVKNEEEIYQMANLEVPESFGTFIVRSPETI